MKTAIPSMLTSLVVVFALPFFAESQGAEEHRIGVLTLHGVGSQRQGRDFDKELRAALQQQAGRQTAIIVKTVHYHGKSRTRQQELCRAYDRMEDRSGNLLDQMIIRRLMLASVGDALAYANDQTAPNSYYRRTHEELRNTIDKLEAELGDGQPVVVVAHSLGCKVIFDYLCDVQNGRGIWDGTERPSEFQKLANLRLLITTGCSLPFFESVVPIAEQRFFRINSDFQWVNFYDRDDPLGWPLRQLGGRFEEIVQDKERNGLGNVLTSHLRYWTDEDLNEEIAGRILKLTEVDEQTGNDE
ncbi:MAG: hypothetical protein ABGZ53_00750 [Fuerstiella sp.]